jgi:hypothetical protein
MNMTTLIGTIVRVNNGGVAYADVPSLEQLAGFTFGKIDGYRGESAKELGLKPGRRVSIEYNDKKQINSVTLSD